VSLRVEFWSSVELGTFARGLMRALRAGGFEANHRFEVGESSYRMAQGALARAGVRWRSYVAYPVELYSSLHGDVAPDVVVVCTNTFYAPAVAVRAAARLGIPVVNWIFDLFPDVLVQGKTVREGGALQALLGRLTRWTFENAAGNVFLGRQLREHAELQYGQIPRSAVIPVGADGEAFRSDPPRARSKNRPLGILYCGNLGRMHDIETILELLRRRPAPPWTLEFRGHGAGFRRLAAAAAQAGTTGQVRFGASLGDAEWTDAMKGADIALVTLKPGAEGLVMPSKTYSAMVAGQAILAVCPLESELADTVRRHDAGWVVPPGDGERLAVLLDAVAARPEEVLRKRLNAFRAGHDVYDQTALMPLWTELLTSVSAARGKRGR
jgi:colanic acid biosynthesis glycosyl transferase WcaI